MSSTDSINSINDKIKVLEAQKSSLLTEQRRAFYITSSGERVEGVITHFDRTPAGKLRVWGDWGWSTPGLLGWMSVSDITLIDPPKWFGTYRALRIIRGLSMGESVRIGTCQVSYLNSGKYFVLYGDGSFAFEEQRGAAERVSIYFPPER